MAVFFPVYLAVWLLTRLLAAVRWDAWWPHVQRRLGIRRRVLFLEPLYPEGSGFEYRIAAWVPVLEAAGFETRVMHPLPRRTIDALQSGGWTGLFFALYLLRRLPQCLAAPLFNCVIVRRELLLYNDYGGLFLDRLLLALNPNAILDFDDDISAAKREPRELTRVGRVLLESPTKFADSLRLYPRLIAGSGYLADLAAAERRGAPADIEVVPTCVNYHDLPPKAYGNDHSELVLGWIGTNGNLPLLEGIVPVLEELSDRLPIRLVVISGRDVGVQARFPLENRSWSLESQISDLMEVDIGLMPLTDTREHRGKCGFKLIQYMGLGIVSVASAVTTNREIVQHGENGFLVEPDGDWAGVLDEVARRRDEFARIGEAAQARVEHHYSFTAHSARYVELVERACEGRAPRLTA